MSIIWKAYLFVKQLFLNILCFFMCLLRLFAGLSLVLYLELKAIVTIWIPLCVRLFCRMYTDRYLFL